MTNTQPQLKCNRCAEVLLAANQIKDALLFFNVNQDEKNRIYSPLLDLTKIITDIESDIKKVKHD